MPLSPAHSTGLEKASCQKASLVLPKKSQVATEIGAGCNLGLRKSPLVPGFPIGIVEYRIGQDSIFEQSSVCRNPENGGESLFPTKQSYKSGPSTKAEEDPPPFPTPTLSRHQDSAGAAPSLAFAIERRCRLAGEPKPSRGCDDESLKPKMGVGEVDRWVGGSG